MSEAIGIQEMKIRAASRVAIALLPLLLQGCENAYEHVSENKWGNVGKNEIPASSVRGGFTVSTLVRGRGPAVQAGDLVYARIRVVKLSGITAGEPQVYNAWIWSGSSPSDIRDAATADTWADMAPARLRATLAGKKIGDKYTVQPQEDAKASRNAIPLYALADRSSMEPHFKAFERWTWPLVELGRDYAEIEVLEACPARLLRRTAALTQWGLIIPMFDTYYPTRRAGTLGWTALEADCATPRGKIRFEIGPLYEKTHQLYNWERSYNRTHLKNSWLGLTLRLLLGCAAFAVMYRLARGAKAPSA